MKKVIYFIITIVIIVGLGIFYMTTRNSTFKEAILNKDDMSSVTSIEIIQRDNQGENEVTVTDSSQIKTIIDDFSKIKLRKSSNSEMDFTESYWMTFKDNDGKRNLGITLYDNDHMNTFVYDAAAPKNASKSYAIVTDFDLTFIQGLFK